MVLMFRNVFLFFNAMVNFKFLKEASEEIRMVRSWGAQEVFPVSSRFL